MTPPDLLEEARKITDHLKDYPDPMAAFDALVEKANADQLFKVPMLRSGILQAILRAEYEELGPEDTSK